MKRARMPSPRPDFGSASGLTRRGVLRGLGATVALPFLESLAPKPARAQTGGGPRRFFAFYVPCGIRMDTWTPASEGRDFVLPPVLQPLAPVRDDVLVLSHLENYAAEPQGDGAGGHARGTVTFLSATHPSKQTLYNGTTIDQVVANLHAGQTRLKSIELGCESGFSAGTCDSGYSCVYQRAISWASPYTPLDKEVNPRAMFDRLFGADALLSPEERAVRRRHDRSLLDFVVGETQRLKPRLGARDKRKLDEYLTGVRELERRIASTDGEGRCELPDRPSGATTDTPAYVKQMLDLVALAYQCDITRVASFMIANGGTTRSYPHLDVFSAHHELSHHQGLPDKLDGLLRINTWEVEEFAYLLGKLKDIEEEGPSGEPANALYNTVAVFGSEIADGDRHNNDDMPVLVAGQGGGFLDSGRHVLLPEKTPIANLYLTIAQHYGAPVDRFGDDGTELLPQILA